MLVAEQREIIGNRQVAFRRHAQHAERRFSSKMRILGSWR
jgi:hypothetical protein